MAREMTVVYTIHDEDAFAAENKRLADLHKAFDPERPPLWGVSAASCDNEIRRVELIEQAIAENDPEDAIDAIEQILAVTGNSLPN